MINSNFPVKVQLKYNSFDNPIPALMYSIHYVGDSNPMATCYLTESKCWTTIDLAFITPVFDENNNKEKKVLME